MKRKLLGSLSGKVERTAQNAPHANDATLPHRIIDVTPNAAEIDLAALDVIGWAPVWMTRAERLLLYSLIFGLRPERYLEIGTLQGGSALIVNAAMSAQGSPGRIICVDPNPKIAPEHWDLLKHRATLVEGFSPQALSQAQEFAGGVFDFVLIDGDHSYEGVLRDAMGVKPHLAPFAYLLFHDSFNPDVARGIQEAIARQHGEYVSFGSLTREATFHPQPHGDPVRWAGLLLAQYRPG